MKENNVLVFGKVSVIHAIHINVIKESAQSVADFNAF